jgi:hypothetical protein
MAGAAGGRLPGMVVSPSSDRRTHALLVALALCVAAWPVQAEGGDITNEYQLKLSPYHKITEELSGFGSLEYDNNPAQDSSTYKVGWPGLTYTVNRWLQLWGGLLVHYTDNRNSADQLELRPYAGVKLFVPNQAHIHLYNFTRYEYRALEDLGTHDWNNYSRLRSRFGVEVPLIARQAWQPKTRYALADVEPFYRFDKDEMNPLRVRGGIGYILSEGVRPEFIYTAQFTPKGSSSPLEYTENIFRLNIKTELARGLLNRLQNPDVDD